MNKSIDFFMDTDEAKRLVSDVRKKERRQNKHGLFSFSPSEFKEERRRLGLTQTKISELLGVSFCTVNRWERGRVKPSPMAIQSMSAIFGEKRKRHG